MTVMQTQCLLCYLGYYRGAVDGQWGAQSRSACAEFQRAWGGLQPDGIAGEQTHAALLLAVAQGMPRREEGDLFWNGIQYWNREEFRCRCGGKYCSGFPAEPDEGLVKLAETVRIHFGRPGHSSSGLRCSRWNALQGGVSNSRHMEGKALDFRIEGYTAAQVLAYLQDLPGVRYAYAIDDTYVHMDVE